MYDTVGDVPGGTCEMRDVGEAIRFDKIAGDTKHV